MPQTVLSPPRKICNRPSLSVCLLAALRKNFQRDLHEIFREGWRWAWANEQTIKLVAIRITDPNQYRDTGKTCLGGGMHSPSVTSVLTVIFHMNPS